MGEAGVGVHGHWPADELQQGQVVHRVTEGPGRRWFSVDALEQGPDTAQLGGAVSDGQGKPTREAPSLHFRDSPDRAGEPESVRDGLREFLGTCGREVDRDPEILQVLQDVEYVMHEDPVERFADEAAAHPDHLFLVSSLDQAEDALGDAVGHPCALATLAYVAQLIDEKGNERTGTQHPVPDKCETQMEEERPADEGVVEIDDREGSRRSVAGHGRAPLRRRAARPRFCQATASGSIRRCRREDRT